MPVSDLFESLVEHAGLPRVVARASLRRALRRADVEPGALDASDLARALPSLEETLRVYLEPDQVSSHMATIRALAGGGGDDEPAR